MKEKLPASLVTSLQPILSKHSAGGVLKQAAEKQLKPKPTADRFSVPGTQTAGKGKQLNIEEGKLS